MRLHSTCVVSGYPAALVAEEITVPRLFLGRACSWGDDAAPSRAGARRHSGAVVPPQEPDGDIRQARRPGTRTGGARRTACPGAYTVSAPYPYGMGTVSAPAHGGLGGGELCTLSGRPAMLRGAYGYGMPRHIEHA